MTRVITSTASLPGEEDQRLRLEEALLQLGPRCLVLLEGPDDVGVFENWYSHHADRILFFDAGGSGRIESFLTYALETTSQGAIYAIQDRDYRPDEEVALWRTEPLPRRFHLTRHELENYLLEPAAIVNRLQVLFRGRRTPPRANEVEQRLIEMCQSFLPITAANYLLQRQNPTARLFGEVIERGVLIRALANHLGLSEDVVEEQLSTQEVALNNCLTSLDQAHSRIEGKWLFEQVYRAYELQGTSREVWRNLLAEEIGRLGLHPDIREIVEHYILGLRA